MASQAIKYQSTQVEPVKSAQEIAAACIKYGASRFEMQWNEKAQLTGVRFALRHAKWGEVPIRLEARTDKIADLLYRKTSMDHIRSREQAYRIAWRQLKDFVEQALFAVETGLFPMHEVFFAQIETRDPQTGELVAMATLIERHGTTIPGGGIALLPAPPTLDAEYEVED